MSSAWAVVIGAIVSFAGTTGVAWLNERWRRKNRLEEAEEQRSLEAEERRRARRVELGTLLPKLVESLASTPEPTAGETALMLRIQILIENHDARIGAMLLLAAAPPHRADANVASAAAMLTAIWLRGEKGSDQVVGTFEQLTGLKVDQLGSEAFLKSR